MAEIKLIGVADDDMSREQGLMFVSALPEMSGLLFKFDSPRILSFWMQNTYLPLDIAFLDKDGIIVKTESMIPLSTRSVTSGRPCIMALEVLYGTLAKAGVGIGQKAKIDLENKVVSFD